jgi:hypothetical protein
MKRNNPSKCYISCVPINYFVWAVIHSKFWTFLFIVLLYFHYIFVDIFNYIKIVNKFLLIKSGVIYLFISQIKFKVTFVYIFNSFHIKFLFSCHQKFFNHVYIVKMNAVIDYSDNCFTEIVYYANPLQWSINLLNFHQNWPFRE